MELITKNSSHSTLYIGYKEKYIGNEFSGVNNKEFITFYIIYWF